MMHLKEIEISGRRVAYYQSRGKGQPVLLVHGNSMSGRCFARQLESPLGEEYRLVALDLPGHGESAAASDAKNAYTLPGYAELVTAFVRELGIDDALLVGWSLGGHVLLEASARLPKAVGLMIFGTPPVAKPMAADAFIPNPLFHLMFTSEMSEAEALAVTAGLFMPGSRIDSFFCEDLRGTDGSAREALGLSVAQGNYTDEVAVAANLDKPLAVVHGEHEPLVSLAYLKALHLPTLWRGEIQIVPAAGHTLHWEQPQAFNRLLESFITDCTVGAVST